MALDLAPALGAFVVLLALHLAVLFVNLVRAIMPARRSPAYALSVAAGLAAIAGELMLLGALIGRRMQPLVPLAFLLGAFVAGLAARHEWRETASGPIARQAVFAAPLGLVVVMLVLLT